MSVVEQQRSTCLCALFARATEWAALAGARWLGRDDQDAAEKAAEGAMLAGLAELPIDGTVVRMRNSRSGERSAPAERRSTSRSIRWKDAASSRGEETAPCR